MDKPLAARRSSKRSSAPVQLVLNIIRALAVSPGGKRKGRQNFQEGHYRLFAVPDDGSKLQLGKD
jgi:hypothetical protein